MLKSQSRGRVWIVVAALVVAVAALAFVVAQGRQTVSTEVRINVRQLEDGSSEFALQQRDGDSWGERMLVAQRFVAQDVGHSRWIASAPFLIEIEAPTPTSSAPEDLMQAAGDSPSAAADGPPDDVLSGFRFPLPATATYGEGETRDWFAVRVHMTGGGDHYVSCKIGSGKLYERIGSSWALVDGDQVAQRLTDARHPSAHLAVSDRLTEQCGVNVASPFHMGGDPPDFAPYNLPPLDPTARMETHWLGDWRLWRVPRDGRPALEATCYKGGGAVHVLGAGDAWSAASASELMSLVVGAYENIPQLFADEIADWCGMTIDAALVTRADAQRQAEQRQTSTGPPDEVLIHSTDGLVTGNYHQIEEWEGWSTWQMHHADGPDAYAACQLDSGVLHGKTHGGDWSQSSVQGLRALFGFAEWYWIDMIMQGIGETCGVHAPATGPPDQRQVAVEPEPTCEASWGQSKRSDLDYGNRAGGGQLAAWVGVSAWWHSKDDSRVKFSVWIDTEFAVEVTGPWVTVEADNRSYRFAVIDGDAVLSGIDAWDFWVAAVKTGSLTVTLASETGGPWSSDLGTHTYTFDLSDEQRDYADQPGCE